MSFFTGSSGFIINGGTFTSVSFPTKEAGRFLFSFQALLLTVTIAAAPTQVLWNGKDRDDSRESDDYAKDLLKRSGFKRLKTLDGIMVC